MSVCTARLAVVAAAALTLAGCASSAGATPMPVDTPSPVTGAAATGPAAAGWAAPADVSAAVRAAGLPMLGEEKLAVHYHAHLDVIVNGNAVPVPAGLGIDEGRQLISPLHTHDGSGIVHIETAIDMPFILGQVFTEWGHPLRADRVGPVTLAGHRAAGLPQRPAGQRRSRRQAAGRP